MQVIISTVGISMQRNLGEDTSIKRKFQEFTRLPVKDTLEAEGYQELFKILVQKAHHDPFDPTLFSAETNSLARMQVAKGDHLYFLATDSLAAKLCGEVLSEICQQKWGAKTHVQVLKGLQVADAKKFQEEGIRSLVLAVRRICEQYRKPGHPIVLNITGGYKAVVPYLTLLGLIEGIPVKYVYEEYGHDLIELPALPLDFDYSVLERLRQDFHPNTIARLTREGAFEDDLCFIANLTHQELVERYRKVFVWEGNRVKLSSLARLILERES
ncbi:putative CRISPR-associated protein [Thermoflavimicrobium dichotomicum]|uniref:Putative CRISPR-associated protein, APE2256 family n=1 Tax=Thermoflavimicrobium dichotomicum TaxID=46223 RepID=A0A1I3US16_9BACL|nr:putative CRISPR-associated protein [Thermoflavimicrobium dichotomicum]SFJ85543.1 putative CRISPR-associated protein, APE2256 family [Thermoflavimicrobium dichotomicum]